jgi:hypothetical protein
MKYMLLLYGPDRPFPQPGTSEFREMFEAWEVAKEEMAKAGVLIDCAPLQPPSAATHGPGPGRPDAAHRRARRRDQGAVRRLHPHRVHRPG